MNLFHSIADHAHGAITALVSTTAAVVATGTATDQINAYTGIGTMIGLILIGILNKLDARKAVKAAAIAAQVAKDTHTLVNSNMGLQLRKSMLQSRRIADMSAASNASTKVEDARMADEDERIYNEHVAKQAVVDAK
jgi:hypothetical protein